MRYYATCDWVEVVILHWDYPITLTVEYSFQKGTTLGMGPDPDYLSIISAVDGTDSDVLNKLSRKQWETVEAACYDDALSNYSTRVL